MANGQNQEMQVLQSIQKIGKHNQVLVATGKLYTLSEG